MDKNMIIYVLVFLLSVFMVANLILFCLIWKREMMNGYEINPLSNIQMSADVMYVLYFFVWRIHNIE